MRPLVDHMWVPALAVFSSSGIFPFFGGKALGLRAHCNGSRQGRYLGAGAYEFKDHMGIVFDRAVWLAELDTRQ